MSIMIRVFLFPGDVVRKRLGITVEEDGGMIRSFVNMCVWGTLLLAIGLHYFT